MKHIKYIITFLIFIFATNTFAEEVFTYRGITFASTKSLVRDHEKYKPDVMLVKEEDNRLIYTTKIFGHDAYIFYDFWHNMLYEINLILGDNNKNIYYEQYPKILRVLRNKYSWGKKEYINKNKCNTLNDYAFLSNGCGFIKHNFYLGNVYIALVAGQVPNESSNKMFKYRIDVIYTYIPLNNKMLEEQEKKSEQNL